MESTLHPGFGDKCHTTCGDAQTVRIQMIKTMRGHVLLAAS